MVEVKIPEVGESIIEVQIGEWLKAEGDSVQKDDSLAVIESEKTNFELPAPAAGKLARILSPAGQTVKVGATVAQIEPGGDDNSSRSAKAPAREQPEPKPSPEPSHKPGRSEKPEPKVQSLPAEPSSPPPRQETAAETAPVEPSSEVPTAPEPAAVTESPEPPEGIKGRDTSPRRPLQRQSARLGEPSLPSTEREEEVVPMSMLRRTVARRLLEAQRSMAMLTTFNEVDMGAVQALRQQRQEAFQKRYNTKLGLMSFFVKAAVAALKEFPPINAEVRGDDIVYRNYFDIGVAIASPQGLVVPVLANAERLSFAEIESAIADFARRAKERQLKPEELEGGTFTITNGGVFGSMLSTPIINPPQSGILGLHAIVDRPVAREGSVVIRPIMYVALTYDHRLVDGREAVLFLRRIKELIEDPARMLIEA
jgi:2-oxoglutarate dehydrogenase E2 component (dihydrolipoamide succinyltransferase)